MIIHPDPYLMTFGDTRLLAERGVSIRLMVGGAGGAFIELFNNFEGYYPLLHDTLVSRPWISGIDLDVEEDVDIYNIVMLVNRIVLILERILQYHLLQLE